LASTIIFILSFSYPRFALPLESFPVAAFSPRAFALAGVSPLITFLTIFLAMFPFFPSGSYFNNWMLIISYLPIGIYLGLYKKS
jgi:hypothetical protein